MLELCAHEPSHSKGVHSALRLSVWMRDVVDQLDLVHLLYTMDGNHSPAATKARTVRQGGLGCVVPLRRRRRADSREIRIEHVEDHPAAWNEMTADRIKTAELILDRHEVLHRTKRNDRQREPILDREVAHVALDERDPRLHVIRLLG